MGILCCGEDDSSGYAPDHLPSQQGINRNRPVLGYWKIRGLASQIRYEMVYLGVDYVEDQYEQGDGPGFDRSSWTSVKESLGLPFPNLPYLIDGQVKMTETNAIMRYLATKHGPELLGKTPE